MKHKILKLCALASLLLSFGWMLNNPDWEPKITFLGTLATLLGLEFYEERSRAKSPDVELFKKFLEQLPSNGSIQYLRDTDMAGPVETAMLRTVNRFTATWNNAEHEFLDKKIDQKRKELIQLVNGFFVYFGLNTWNVRDDIQRVPPEWTELQPERFEQVVSTLNKSADQIVSCHQELVRLGKKRLKV